MLQDVGMIVIAGMETLGSDPTLGTATCAHCKGIIRIKRENILKPIECPNCHLLSQLKLRIVGTTVDADQDLHGALTRPGLAVVGDPKKKP